MLKYILPILLITLCWTCAKIDSPKGGPIDKTPPVMDTKRSTPNFQTNFTKQRIEFVFDEFVELKDIFTQVVVSPPLQEKWRLSSKLRTVRFDFAENEVLRPNATYTINFGEAVRDFNEANVVPDLRFVFSTGDYIDSLQVSGRIVDALTEEPAADVLLMLYDNLNDTIVRTERPFYFAKTDKDGRYSINNVKSDTFKVFALKDADLNYLFNQTSEQIGFPDSFLILSSERNQLPTLKVFTEQQALKLINKNSRNYGLSRLIFNQVPRDVEVNIESVGQKVYYEKTLDTLKVWYDLETPQNWSIYLQQDTSFRDTVLVKATDRAAFFTQKKLKTEKNLKTSTIKINPAKAIRLAFNHPLDSIDQSRIQLLEDTLKTVVAPTLSSEGRELLLDYKWKENLTYEWTILPGALTDFFGLSNQDTLIQVYEVAPEKDFGIMTIDIKGFDPNEAYIIQLFFKNSNTLVKEFVSSGQENFKEMLTTLPPGSYYVKVITDWNKNSRWDSGSYDKQLQPEPQFRKDTEELRAAWELAVEIVWK